MNILYISYDGALDPLGASQVVPYLFSLSQKNIRFTLLTYEKKERLKDKDDVFKLKKKMEERNIEWEILKYHKSPTLPATILDVIIGTIKGLFITLRRKINIIHARSFIGAIPALLLAKSLNLKFIFDMRGFWADERLDGLIWRKKNLLYKVTKWWEKIFLLNADWIICLTEEARAITKGFPYLKKKKIFIDVIPTCADIGKFTIKDKNNDLLTQLNLQNRLVFVYFGNIGTWYMLDEMIDFFKIAKRINSASFFMLLTPEKIFANKKMIEKSIKLEDYFIDYIPYEDIPLWLSLADVSLSFIKPAFSKKSSCPTKFAESLASGLPVVINRGIGDTEKYVNSYNIGLVVKMFSEAEYIKVANQLFKILEDRDNLRMNCRKVAEYFFSLEKGVEKYWEIYQKLNQFR